ncbi:LexA family transcriptional regulator [uncultured Oscillibacter sp.]|uniref:LexA family protein n=1 Tax=uncultured Oscillibacter sp. TaxID=876091 RepID=UPI0025F83D9A|nr:S24 family peptidase [uncultured Oscillibacter sp.]
MDTVDRIFDLVDRKYKEQRDFAAQLGVTPSIVSEWRRRKSSSFNRRLPQIAEALGTTTEYLLTGNGPKKKTAPAGVSNSDTVLPKGAEHIDLGTFHRIPILGRISAGLPLYAEQHIEGYTVTDLNGQAEYFALIVHGDSMNALGINDGYRIIVRRQDTVENGEVAVVMVGDEDATVKRFYATGSTVTLMPQSTNPEHQPQIYDTSKTKIRVIGRVVKVEFTL